MRRSVVLLDGPVGVGKTTLGRRVATARACGFIDGDDCSEPGPWLRSIRRTSHRIVSQADTSLQRHPVVIVAYPLRRTNWIFFHRTFWRMGIDCRCIGLVADSASIRIRQRRLDRREIARSEEMIAQGYGRRPFSDAVLRTDACGFEETARRLERVVGRVLTGASR